MRDNLHTRVFIGMYNNVIVYTYIVNRRGSRVTMIPRGKIARTGGKHLFGRRVAVIYDWVEVSSDYDFFLAMCNYPYSLNGPSSLLSTLWQWRRKGK